MLRLTGLRLLVCAVASALLFTGQVTPAQIEIPGVSPEALERVGMKFLVPNGAPTISKEEARSVAMTEAMTFDLPIKQTVLVRMVDVNAGPAVDQLVWVNMIDLTEQPDPFFTSGPYVAPNRLPTGNYIPEGSPEPRAATPEPLPRHTYYMIFVDANTGEYLYAYAG